MLVDPGTIVSALQVIKKIYDKIQQARNNKERYKALGQRLAAIEAKLTELCDANNAAATAALLKPSTAVILDSLMETLLHCSEIVGKKSGACCVSAVVKSEGDAAQITEINVQLSQYNGDLALALQVDTLVTVTETQVHVVENRKENLQNFDEMHRSQKEVLVRLEKSEKQTAAEAAQAAIAKKADSYLSVYCPDAPLHAVAKAIESEEPLDVLMAIVTDPRCGINNSLFKSQDFSCIGTIGVLKQKATPIVAAATLGRVDLVKALLTFPSCRVNASDVTGLSAITAAATTNRPDIIRALLHSPHHYHQLNCNQQNEKGNTALAIACVNGYSECVRVLLSDRRVNLHIPNAMGHTPLLLSAMGNQAEAVELLLKAAADQLEMDDGENAKVATVEDRAAVGEEGGGGSADDAAETDGAVHVSIDDSRTASKQTLAGSPSSPLTPYSAVPRSLLNSNSFASSVNNNCANINTNTSNGNRRVDLNAKTASNGTTALMTAALQGNAAIVKLLLDVAPSTHLPQASAASPTSASSFAGIITPVSPCQLHVNAQNDSGNTALHFAVLGGHAEVLRLLSEDPRISANATNTKGTTALQYAVLEGFVEGVEILLANPSVNPNQYGGCCPKSNAVTGAFSGNTAFHLSILKGNEAIFRLLLEDSRTDLNLKNNQMMNASSSTSISSNSKPAARTNSTLVGGGGETEVTTTTTTTTTSVTTDHFAPLHLAALGGYAEFVRLLMAHPNVDVNVRSGAFCSVTAAQVAAAAKEKVDAEKAAAKASRGFSLCKNKKSTQDTAAAAKKAAETASALAASLQRQQQSCPQSTNLTPLMAAALNGHAAVIRLLLADDRVEVNAKDRGGLTALMIAASKGHGNALLALLSDCPAARCNGGGDGDDTDENGVAAVGVSAIAAELGGELALAEAEVSQSRFCFSRIGGGATLCAESSAPLMIDTNLNTADDAATKRLADSDGTASEGSGSRMSMMSFGGLTDDGSSSVATFSGGESDSDDGFDFVSGTDRILVNEKNNAGDSALHLAAANGHACAVKLLVQLGCADLKQRNGKWRTPLSVARWAGRKSVVKVIVGDLGYRFCKIRDA